MEFGALANLLKISKDEQFASLCKDPLSITMVRDQIIKLNKSGMSLEAMSQILDPSIILFPFLSNTSKESKLLDLEKSVCADENELAHNLQSLSQIESMIGSVERERNEVECSLTACTRRRDNDKAKCQTLQQNVTDIDKEILELQELKASKSIIICNLTDNVQREEAAISEYSASYSLLDDRLAKLKNEISSLHIKISGVRSRIRDNNVKLAVNQKIGVPNPNRKSSHPQVCEILQREIQESTVSIADLTTNLNMAVERIDGSKRKLFQSDCEPSSPSFKYIMLEQNVPEGEMKLHGSLSEKSAVSEPGREQHLFEQAYESLDSRIVNDQCEKITTPPRVSPESSVATYSKTLSPEPAYTPTACQLTKIDNVPIANQSLKAEKESKKQALLERKQAFQTKDVHEATRWIIEDLYKLLKLQYEVFLQIGESYLELESNLVDFKKCKKIQFPCNSAPQHCNIEDCNQVKCKNYHLSDLKTLHSNLLRMQSRGVTSVDYYLTVSRLSILYSMNRFLEMNEIVEDYLSSAITACPYLVAYFRNPNNAKERLKDIIPFKPEWWIYKSLLAIPQHLVPALKSKTQTLDILELKATLEFINEGLAHHNDVRIWIYKLELLKIVYGSENISNRQTPLSMLCQEFEAAIHANPTEFDIWWNYIDWFTSSADCGLLDRFFQIAEQKMNFTQKSKAFTNIIMMRLRFDLHEVTTKLDKFLFKGIPFHGIAKNMLTCKDFTFLVLVLSMMVRTGLKQLPKEMFEPASRHKQAIRKLFLMKILGPSKPLATVLSKGLHILHDERKTDQDLRPCVFALAVNLYKASGKKPLSREFWKLSKVSNWILESAQFREMVGMPQIVADNSSSLIYKFKKDYSKTKVKELGFLQRESSIYGIIAQIIIRRSQGMEYILEEWEYHKKMTEMLQ